MLDRLPKLCVELTMREDVADEVKTMLKKLMATEKEIGLTTLLFMVQIYGVIIYEYS